MCNTIILCGAYGQDNIGDRAILTIALEDLRATMPNADIVVLSRKPRKTRREFGVKSFHLLNLPRLYFALRRAKLFIQGGGNLLQDATSRRSFWLYSKTLRMAKRAGCGVVLYACGLGPLSPTAQRRATKLLTDNVDAATFREAASATLATPSRHEITADLAFRLMPSEADDVLPAKAFAFILRDWKGVNVTIFAAACEHVRDKHGLTPILLLFARADMKLCRKVAQLVSCEVLPYIEDTRQCLTLVGQLRGVLSLRLHGLIFATSQNVPAAAIDFDGKLRAACEYMNNRHVLSLDDLTIDPLKALIDAVLSETIPQARCDNMRQLAARNRELLAEWAEEFDV